MIDHLHTNSISLSYCFSHQFENVPATGLEYRKVKQFRVIGEMLLVLVV